MHHVLMLSQVNVHHSPSLAMSQPGVHEHMLCATYDALTQEASHLGVFCAD